MRQVHRLELEGERFGRWTVLSLSHKNQRGEVFWLCRCDCGKERPVKANSLRNGRSTSCGCYHKSAVTKHGWYGTPTFKSWESMKQRCLNPKAPDYPNYGGQGVKIYEPWINSFPTFLADMGERPEGKTLDRKSSDGDYTPENCRWATSVEQLRNRRSVVMLTRNGVTKNAYEWAEEVGVPGRVIKDRVRRGWTVEKALTTPLQTAFSRKGT